MSSADPTARSDAAEPAEPLSLQPTDQGTDQAMDQATDGEAVHGAVEETVQSADGEAVQAAGKGGATDAAGPDTPPRKGPLSFLSGAITSGLFAWGCLLLSERVVGYYSLHPPHYSARVAQSIATAVKTLVVGMTFLATFTFAFVGLGLFLVFLRSLFGTRAEEST